MGHTMRKLLPIALLLTVSSCAMLDEMISVVNPDTGETTEVRAGDLAADAVDSYSGAAAEVVSILAPNPVIGAGIGAALLAAAAAASTRLRKKKPPTII